MCHAFPPKRRSLFVQLTLESFPTLFIFNHDPVLKRSLMEDFIHELGGYISEDEAVLKLAEKKLIKSLATMFQFFNKTNEFFGFPAPDEALETELEAHRRTQNCDRERQKLMALHAASPNNPRQAELYEILTNCIDEGATKLVFLQGQGGSGKTTFAKICQVKGSRCSGLRQYWTSLPGVRARRIYNCPLAVCYTGVRICRRL